MKFAVVCTVARNDLANKRSGYAQKINMTCTQYKRVRMLSYASSWFCIYNFALTGPEGLTNVAPAAARTVAFRSFTFVTVNTKR